MPFILSVIDLHVHSACSADGQSSIDDYARRAAALGLAEIGFCEHADFDPRDEGYGSLDVRRYHDEIAAAQVRVPTVRLRQGVEITYQAGLEGEIRAWLSTQSWDYVVASVHLVDHPDGWAIISEPGSAAAYFTAHTARQAYLPYFQELLCAASSGLGNVLGHLDLVKRYGCAAYGRFEPAAFEDEIRAVLRAMIEHGVGLEVNTSGLRQSPGEPYPGLTVLRWFRELGGEVLTFGSDAHHAGHLAAGFAQALEMVRATGFRAIATFEKRQCRWIDLDRVA